MVNGEGGPHDWVVEWAPASYSVFEESDEGDIGEKAEEETEGK